MYRRGGPTLLENIVQGTAGDFLALGCIRAAKLGFEIFGVIHDQALAHYDKKAIEKGLTPEMFSDALCVLPDWAEGFPLSSTCDITPYFTKVD